MNQVVITVVGGGAFSPRLCEALARAIDIPELELRLSARRADRLRILAEHSAARLAPLRPGWSVRASPSLEAALEGASLVVLLVRVGGLEARAWDETFPRRFGLAGDEGLGPGGIANAWRTLPKLAAIAGALRRISPNAGVMNLMAPLGMTTRLLLEEGLSAFGVCELPLVTLEAWLSYLGETPAGATWRYGGLNHLGWFWHVRVGAEDVLKLLADCEREVNAPVDPSTIKRYQAAPLRYFYEVFDRDAARRLGLERPPGRAEQLLALSDELVQRFAGNPGLEMNEVEVRNTPWLDRAVAPIASALLGGPPHAGFINLINEGKIPELPPELVVEVAATFTPHGASPTKPGPLPAPVASFLYCAAEAEALTYQAARERSPSLLANAIRALPLSIPENAVLELTELAQRERP
jgi:6-phospho-beta-glucosidase